MQDDLEKQLIALGESYPLPSSDAERRALAALLTDTDSRQRKSLGERFNLRRKHVALGFALAATAALAFVAGVLLAPSRAAANTPVSAGPGFLPHSGWNTASTGVTGPPRAPTALAANVPIASGDATMLAPPTATIRSLGSSGVLLLATFYTPTLKRHVPIGYPPRNLPLRLSDAVPSGSVEGFANKGLTEQLEAAVDGYDIDLLIFFGTPHPSPEVRAAADAEVRALVVPGCPTAAESLTAGDRAAATAFLNTWFATRYSGFAASLLHGAHLSASVVENDPLTRDEVVRQCGQQTARETMSVRVLFTAKARAVVGNAPIVFFVYRQVRQWLMWRQAG